MSKTDIPERLIPYLQDMLVTGLWGTTIQEVCVRLLERGIEGEIIAGTIDQRRDGKVVAQED